MSSSEPDPPPIVDLEIVDTDDLIEELFSRFDSCIFVSHIKQPQRGQAPTKIRKSGTPIELLRLSLITSLQLHQSLTT